MKNTVNGDYLNLPDFIWLDLDKYYRSQGYNDMAAWGDGYQYTASGSIALSLFRYMYVTLYNKDIMVNYQLNDPYETVAAGTWTIEYQTQLTSGMYRDLNGDGLSGKEDAFGFVSGNHISSDPYWISSQATVPDKDENGYYIYNADTARIYDAVDAVLALYYRPDAFIFLEENDQTSSESIITAIIVTPNRILTKKKGQERAVTRSPLLFSYVPMPGSERSADFIWPGRLSLAADPSVLRFREHSTDRTGARGIGGRSLIELMNNMSEGIDRRTRFFSERAGKIGRK